MSSLKQIKNRLQNKKNSLIKLDSSIARMRGKENKVVLRRLNMEKTVLASEIKKLERQLMAIVTAARIKINPSLS